MNLPKRFSFGRWRALVITGVCATGFAASVSGGTFTQGQRPDALFSRDYLHLLVADTTGIISSPAQWDRGDWETAGLLSAAIAGAAVFDRKARDWTQDHRTSGRDRFFRTEQRLGAEWAFAVLGGFETSCLPFELLCNRDCIKQLLTEVEHLLIVRFGFAEGN